MSTFFSDEKIGTWSGYSLEATLTGSVSRSGNTVTLYDLEVSLYATNAWGSDSGFWMAIRDGGSELTRSTGLSMSGGHGSRSFSNVSVSVGASTTSYEFNLRSSDGYTVYFTVYFPAGTSAPATPFCNPSSNSSSLVNVSWGTSNLGNPSGTVRLYTGTTNNPTEFLYSKNTTGTNVFGHDQRTANTRYYYKATAANSIGTVSSAVKSAVTYPAGVSSLSVSSMTSDTVTLSATFASSGNALTTGVEVGINSTSNWNGLSITDVQGTTQSITLAGFQPETAYTVYMRVFTTAGNSVISSVSFTTPPENKFYGSANGEAKLIKKLYGSVGGQTKAIKRLYGSINGETKLIYKG